ncbi:unnamed protein product [Pedinophyceae sp. YPF-701]|nr:unnamed protein product [Pedinophyceae sp. YPF-701]
MLAKCAIVGRGVRAQRGTVAPVLGRRRVRAAAAADSAGAELLELRKGFHSVQTDGAEFLVATDDKGNLDLGQIFIVDVDEDGDEQFSRPEIRGELPSGLLPYQEMPFFSIQTGMAFKDKPEVRKVHAVTLVSVAELPSDDRTQLMDLASVVTLDGAERVVRREEVTICGEPEKPMLRWTATQGWVVADEEAMPPMSVAAAMHHQGFFDDVKEAEDEELPKPMDLSDLEGVDEDDFDVQDIPSADMM